MRVDEIIFSLPTPTDPILDEARNKPYDIDKQLRSIIHSPDFAPRLDALLHEQASLIGTISVPNLHNDLERPTNHYHYRSCLVLATMLGRAYALVAPDPVVGADQANKVLSKAASSLPYELLLCIHEHYLANLRTRQALWKVVSFIFVKAFFSGPTLFSGARYVAGLLLLTCGKALARTPCLASRGTMFDWFDGRLEEPDRIFRWRDVVDAVMKMRLLPRRGTESRALSSEVEYVSQEIFDVFEAARGHLRDGERRVDWTTAEVLDRFLPKLDRQVDITTST